MFASNSAMTAAVALRKNPAYDPLADFTPISMVGRATIFFYTHPSVPAATLKEFIDHARSNPGKLAYGTGNPLSILYNVQLMNSTGISMLHVPYKGEGPLMPTSSPGACTRASSARATRSRLGRKVSCEHSQYSSTSAARSCRTSRPLPRPAHRPSPSGSGLASSAPKMPRDIVERLNKEVNAAREAADVLEQLQRYGYAAEGSTPEGLTAINREDLAMSRGTLVSARHSAGNRARSPASYRQPRSSR